MLKNCSVKIKKSVQNFSRNVNKNLQVIHEGKGIRAAARYAFKCAGRFFAPNHRCMVASRMEKYAFCQVRSMEHL